MQLNWFLAGSQGSLNVMGTASLGPGWSLSPTDSGCSPQPLCSEVQRHHSVSLVPFPLGPGEHVFLESVYLSFCEQHLAGEGGDYNIVSMWLMGAWKDSRSSLVGGPLQGPLG